MMWAVHCELLSSGGASGDDGRVDGRPPHIKTALLLILLNLGWLLFVVLPLAVLEDELFGLRQEQWLPGVVTVPMTGVVVAAFFYALLPASDKP